MAILALWCYSPALSVTIYSPRGDGAYPKLLAKETLALLEALCWNVTTTDIDK